MRGRNPAPAATPRPAWYSPATGTLRPLAVTTLQRSPALPDVPTIDEAGVPGFEIGAWFALFAPAATPPAVIRKINADLVAILAMPEVREKIEQQAAVPHPETPEDCKAFVLAETKKWGDFVKSLGISLD